MSGLPGMGDRKRLLVTGATGLLGSYLLRAAIHRHDVQGTCHAPPPSDGEFARHLVHLDLYEPGALRRLIGEFRPDTIVHLASLGDVDYCETHEDEAKESIVGWTKTCIESVHRDALVVYVSTNAVFSGEHAPYSEQSPQHPVNHYGRLKVAAERVVADRSGPTTIVRPILCYGWPLTGRRDNPVTWLLKRLQRGESTRLVNDTWSNPLFAGEFARAVLRIVETMACGVFHVAGSDRVSRYEFGQQIAREFGFSTDLIVPVPSSFFPGIAPRPRDTTYCTQRLVKELGLAPVSVACGLAAMRRERRDG